MIPNPWDIGSARLLAAMGFEALATTSAGYAFTVGRPDNTTSRAEMMAHVATICAATPLPVNGDLENGFGDFPEDAAETIRQGAAAGLAGGSIEDSTNRAEEPIYPLDLAVDRIRAASEAARAEGFLLTARCENYLVGRPDLNDTIRRLQAYQEAGADVLYAPGLATKQDIAEVVRSVDRPVNVVMGLQGAKLTVDELSEIGVKRISVGSSLARVALGAMLRAAREMKEQGTFAFAEDAVSFRDINEAFRK
jgi:2-methylisocitrate lyase-like PEP mutase family enzyme